MNRNTLYTYLGIGIVVFIIYLVLIFVFFTRQTPQATQVTPSIAPSPTMSIITTYPFEDITIIFDAAKTKKITDQNDLLVRKQLIGIPGNKMKTIYDSTNFRVQYIPKTDVFMIQLLATDITKARKESISFFTTKGLSMDGICNLPIIFYSNWEQVGGQKTSRPGSGMRFYPPPDGC